MKSLRTFFIFLGLSLAAQIATAQVPTFRRLPEDRDLTQNAVYSILQDRSGYLWVGTLGGLHRHDGLSTRIVDGFGPEQNLDVVRVTALHEDHRGRLWVGGIYGGLDCMDLTANRITHYSETVRRCYGGDQFPQIEAIAVSTEGVVWVATRRGLYRVGESDCSGDAVVLDPSRPKAAVRSVTICADGGVLAVSGGTLHWLAPDGVHRGSLRWPDKSVLSVMETPDGETWAMGQQGLLCRLSLGQDGPSWQAIAVPSEIEDWHFARAGFDDRGVWFSSTSMGIAFWNPETGAVTTYPASPDDLVDHAPTNVRAMTVDRSGVLWVGSDIRGLKYHSPSQDRFASLSRTSFDSVVVDDCIWNIRGGEGDDILLLSRHELMRLDPYRSRYEVISNHEDWPSSIEAKRLLSLLPLGDGRALIGTSNGTLVHVDLATGAATSPAFSPSIRETLEGLKNIRYLKRDRFGSTWVCAEGRTVRLADGLARVQPLPEPLAARIGATSVRAIHETTTGTMWFGTDQAGLIGYDPTTDKVVVIGIEEGLGHLGVRALYSDEHGLWIGTYRGLHRLDLDRLADGVVVVDRWTEADGLPNGTVYDILPGDAGELWMSTNHGLARFDVDNGVIDAYDSADGLSCNEFNGGAAYKNPEGILVFGGIHGTSWFRAGHLYRNDTRPHATLIRLLAGHDAVPGEGRILPDQGLKLDWRTPSLQTAVASLDFQQTRKNKVAYRLKGLDDAWHNVHSGDRILYPHLPTGDYEFQFRAANNDGAWSRTHTLPVQVEPPPWATTWARSGMVLILITALAGIFMMIRRRRHEKLRLGAHLARADKMQAIGQMAGGMAHDFNNYLQVILGQAELARLDLPETHPAMESIDEVVFAGARARALVQRMLSMSRRPSSQRSPLDFSASLDNLERMIDSVIGDGITLDLHAPQGLTILADGEQIDQVMTNLCLNARDAMNGQGRLRISARETALDARRAESRNLEAGPYVEIRVVDDGPGIPEDIRDRIFEPFFSTKPQDKGTGLGLATVYSIVADHGGGIEIGNGPSGGALFRIFLPMICEAPSESVAADEPKNIPGGAERILLADDDRQVRTLSLNMLTQAGYAVTECCDGAEAIAALERDEAFDLAVLDVVMPEKSGRDVYDHMRDKGDETPVIFCTGYSFDHLSDDGVEALDAMVLSKPFSRDQLLAAVREALDALVVC